MTGTGTFVTGQGRRSIRRCQGLVVGLVLLIGFQEEHLQSICSVLSGLHLRVALSGCIDVSAIRLLANDLRIEPLGGNGSDQLLVGYRVRRINKGQGPSGIEVHLDPLHGIHEEHPGYNHDRAIRAGHS